MGSNSHDTRLSLTSALVAPDGVEFGFLAPEEGLGDAGFFFQSGGGEQIGVLAFVLVFAEVAQLDQAFFDQGAQAVVV